MTEENIMQAFGISEDQLTKATSILERSRVNRKFGIFVRLTSKGGSKQGGK